MVEITLFEVHLEDAAFTANAPFSKGEREGEGERDSDEGQDPAGTDTDAAASGDPDVGPPVKLLLGVVALVILVAVARRLAGGDEVSDEELADAVA